MKKENGFTLIETIVIVVAIGLVVAGLIAFFINQHRQSQVKLDVLKTSGHITALIDAQDNFYLNNQRFGTREEIISSGLLKQWPIPIERIADQECLHQYNEIFDYRYDSFNLVEKDREEFLVVLPCVDEKIGEILAEMMMTGSIDPESTLAFSRKTPGLSSGEGGSGSPIVIGDGYLTPANATDSQNFTWFYQWSSCDNGFKIGTPKCYDTTLNGFVYDQYCTEEPKPAILNEACSGSLNVSWHAFPWSSCGTKYLRKYRAVKCMDSSGVIVPDDYCYAMTPDSSQPDTYAFCNDEVSIYNGAAPYKFAWGPNQWSPCYNLSGTTSRTLECWSNYSSRRNPMYCNAYIPAGDKPAETANCPDLDLKFVWVVTSIDDSQCWSGGSATVQTSGCYAVQEASIFKIDDKYCVSVPKKDDGSSIPCL